MNKENIYAALCDVYGADDPHTFGGYLNRELTARIWELRPLNRLTLRALILEYWEGEVLADMAANKVLAALDNPSGIW